MIENCLRTEVVTDTQISNKTKPEEATTHVGNVFLTRDLDL